ncbi:MAG: hypothetical protein R2795_15775 [Saprospiraceae bacterium]
MGNRKQGWILYFLLLLSSIGWSQPMLEWETMADVRFFEKYSNSLGVPYYQAEFGDKIRAMEGKEVVVFGYLIPMDALGQSYALSKNPFSACFFCGASGPETVIELRVKPAYQQRYQTDEKRAFKGRLRLYANSLEQFNYILEEAEPL